MEPIYFFKILFHGNFIFIFPYGNEHTIPRGIVIRPFNYFKQNAYFTNLMSIQDI